MLPRLEWARQLLFLQLLLRHLAYGAALLLVAAALLTLTQRLELALQLGNWRQWLKAAGALTLVTSLLLAWRRTPDLPATARLAERHFGLDERLSTSLEVDALNPLAAALRRDAQAHAAQLRPRRLVRLRPTLRQASALLGGATLLLLSLLLPLPAASARLLAGPAARPVPPAGAAGTALAAPEFLRQLPVATAQEARAATAVQPSTRQPATTPAAPAAVAGTDASQRATVRDAPALEAPSGEQPRQLERQAGSDPALPGAPRGDAAGEPPPAAAAPTARNDGSTNPTYGQASSRDQELREYAKRREATASPGGGGDPVALADASVAGDATAGYDQAGAPPPPAPQAAADELDVGGVTDADGRRVTLERLPDQPGAVEAGTPGVTAWTQRTEPPVARRPLGAADIQLLRRYHQEGSP